MFDRTKVEIVDFKKEEARRDRQRKREETWNKFATFIRDNKDILIICGTVAVPVITGVTKVTSKAIATHNLNKEIRFKERTIYDHSLGRYVELKRPLTSAQSLRIEERRANGEAIHSILNDMGLLKR